MFLPSVTVSRWHTGLSVSKTGLLILRVSNLWLFLEQDTSPVRVLCVCDLEQVAEGVWCPSWERIVAFSSSFPATDASKTRATLNSLPKAKPCVYCTVFSVPGFEQCLPCRQPNLTHTHTHTVLWRRKRRGRGGRQCVCVCCFASELVLSVANKCRFLFLNTFLFQQALLLLCGI